MEYPCGFVLFNEETKKFLNANAAQCFSVDPYESPLPHRSGTWINEKLAEFWYEFWKSKYPSYKVVPLLVKH